MGDSRQEPQLLVVVFGDEANIGAHEQTLSRFADVSLLDFTNSPGSTESLDSDVTQVNYREYVTDSFVGNADDYVDFIEDIKQTELLGEKFGQALNYESMPLSEVITHRFKQKSQSYDHLFNEVGRIEITKRVLADGDYTHALVLADGARRDVVVSRALEREGVRVLERPETPKLRWSLSALAMIVFGVARFGVELVLTVLSKFLAEVVLGRPDVDDSAAFYSVSKHWHQYDWEMNRYYHDLPQYVTESTDLSHVHVLTLSTSSVGELVRSVREIVSLSRSGEPVVLTRATVRTEDVASALIGFLRTCVYTFLLSIRCREETFRLDGVAYRWWLVEGVADRVATVPFYLLTYHGVRRWVRELDPEILTTTHFKGPLGQTAIWAANDDSNVPVLGVQHGPITRGKIQYYSSSQLPEDSLPTRVAVDGALAEELLVDNGVPSDRLTKTGGVRYDRLHERIESVDTESDSEGVTVFFGLSDYRWMVNVVVPTLARLDVEQVVLKPHPSVHEATRNVILEKADDCGLDSFSIVTEDAHQLIRDSRLVIASYSSTAIETLALTTELICITPTNRVDATPFGPDSPVTKARTQDELRAALSDVDGSGVPDFDGFLENFFYSLDGKAKQRVADLIVDVSGSARSERGGESADQ